MQRRLARVRVVTLVVLVTNAAGALFLPAVGLWREPDPGWAGLGVLGIGIFSAAQGAVLYTLVTPWLGDPIRRRVAWAFATATLVSVPTVGPVGGDWPTWSWLAACVVGVLPVLVGRVRAAVLGVLTVGLALALTPGPVVDTLIITVGFGAGVAAVNVLHVWLWELLSEAEQGRTAQARLAAAEERLRFARDVHDLLGHHLTIIALKAELAERLAGTDPDRTGREAAEVRRLAASTLDELRDVVHGYRQVDLGEQLSGIEQILRSSGVRCTVEVPDDDLPAAAVLSAVLREATTNLLRHSRASWCTITFEYADGGLRLTVRNDGVPAGGMAAGGVSDARGHGLRGLAERLVEVGGVLRTRAGGGEFTVEALVPSVP